jgi:hypothetical protein
LLDPAAVIARHPTAQKIKRAEITSEGPNEVWRCDGHDKLKKYGFVIWGMRDKYSGKWLGLWVVPSDRFGIIAAYLWLSAVQKLRGE